MTKVSDAARRIADEMNLHAVAKSDGWAVFRLSDGRPFDHNPYPFRVAAVKATGWDRDRFLYLEIQPDGMQLQHAQACLDFARMLHDAGFRIPSPEFEFDPTMPLMPHDRRSTIRHLAGGRA